MSRACLVDLTKCIGCRGCQVACKQWNGLPAERPTFFAGTGGYQNPPALSSDTFTLVGYNEVEDDAGDLRWVFAKQQCMHCLEPSCAAACPVKALQPTPEGTVKYLEHLCMGCRYCMVACPFEVPTFEYDNPVPSIRKCTFCMDRQQEEASGAELNGQAMSEEQRSGFAASYRTPACAKTCPTGAIKFGDRDELLAVARARVYGEPGKYVHHIFGEHEAGGTSWLYISGVPFEELGFHTNVGTTAYPEYTKTFLTSVPLVIVLGAGLFTGFHWIVKRRDELARAEAGGAPEETTVTGPSDPEGRSTL